MRSDLNFSCADQDINSAMANARPRRFRARSSENSLVQAVDSLLSVDSAFKKPDASLTHAASVFVPMISSERVVHASHGTYFNLFLSEMLTQSVISWSLISSSGVMVSPPASQGLTSSLLPAPVLLEIACWLRSLLPCVSCRQ